MHCHYHHYRQIHSETVHFACTVHCTVVAVQFPTVYVSAGALIGATMTGPVFGAAPACQCCHRDSLSVAV